MNYSLINSECEKASNPNDVYEYLTSLCENTTRPGFSTHNAHLSEIAMDYGVSEELADEIYWFGTPPTPEPEPVVTRVSGWRWGNGESDGGLASRPDDVYAPATVASTGAVCKSCGCSEHDGAMFTTMRGGDVCDDCI